MRTYVIKTPSHLIGIGSSLTRSHPPRSLCFGSVAVKHCVVHSLLSPSRFLFLSYYFHLYSTHYCYDYYTRPLHFLVLFWITRGATKTKKPRSVIFRTKVRWRVVKTKPVAYDMSIRGVFGIFFIIFSSCNERTVDITLDAIGNHKHMKNISVLEFRTVD